MIQPDSGGLYHPKDESEIVTLVQYAVNNNLQVRVRGAAQSAAGSVYTDGWSADKPTTNNINIQLDQMRAVSIDEKSMQATVGGGCNLGYDPFDPTGTSEKSEHNNLFYQLDQKGLALANVPDEIHQTVAGFISTGSSGGSMLHSFDECILSVRMVDGTGNIKTFSKSSNLDDPFYGAVVSMGLFGIITQVTLQCVPAFHVTGTESRTNLVDCKYDFLGPGDESRQSAAQFLSTTEYSRTMWWPFKTLHRVVVWRAAKMNPGDYDEQTGSVQAFKPKPYQSIFPSIEGSRLPAEAVGASGFTMIATWPAWFYELLGINPAEANLKDKLLKDAIEMLFPYLYPKMIDFFMPNDSAKKPAQKFWDYWYHGLPMDKYEYSNSLFDAMFAEMWMPIDQAGKILTDMQNYFTAEGYEATGFFTNEIFAAKRSAFWLSPAYNQDSVRINLLWFGQNTGDPMPYFEKFWPLLAGYRYRPHWGKSLPKPDKNSVDYLKGRYPKWENWMNLRAQMDPHQIFVTEYWRSHLGILAATK